MRDFSQALASLAEPINEPANWLLGDFIPGQAKDSSPHYLLDLLRRPPDDVLVSCNWGISEFRRLVINSEILPQKVNDYPNVGQNAASIKVSSIIEEIVA